MDVITVGRAAAGLEGPRSGFGYNLLRINQPCKQRPSVPENSNLSSVFFERGIKKTLKCITCFLFVLSALQFGADIYLFFNKTLTLLTLILRGAK